MLETIREFGRERLRAGGDLDLSCGATLKHYLGLALQAEAHLTGEDQASGWTGASRSTPTRARRPGGHRDRRGRAGPVAAGALWRFWQQRGTSPRAGSGWRRSWRCRRGRRRPRRGPAALAWAPGIAWWQEDIPAARAHYDEALAIERRLGDPARIAEALYNQAFVAGADGDFETAARLFEESRELYRQVGDEAGIACASGWS